MSKKVDDELFGWELLYKLNETQIKTKQDVLICLTHLVLIRRGFRCAGIGEDKEQPPFADLTELLPEGWNFNRPYKLRYVHNNKLYLLSAVEIDSGDMLLNLNRLADEKVFGVNLDLNDVKNTHGNILTMMPNCNAIVRKLIENLIEPLLKIEITKEVETQTPTELSERPQQRGQMRNIPLSTPATLPFAGNVGYGDLHPVLPGMAGGDGMLFQTPGMSRPHINRPDFGLPPGAVPPGARYDLIHPFAPIQPRPPFSRPNPDHDHLPPPGYDDMFM